MNTQRPLVVVILAAGKSQRMKSSLSKVCHLLGGKPLLAHVLETAQALLPRETYVICGQTQEEIITLALASGVKPVYQEAQLGTAHAVAQALPFIQENSRILVLFGDVPLISKETLYDLLKTECSSHLGVVTGIVAEPTGLGRIIRNSEGAVVSIVEEKDATEEQKKLKEIFSGIMLVSSQHFSRWWPLLDRNNAQNEYYLPAILKLAIAENIAVRSVSVQFEEELLGVNTRSQLAFLERLYQRRQAEKLMAQGVTLRDPSRIDIRGDVTVEMDVTIDVNVILEGAVTLGANVSIGPNSVIKNAKIAKNTRIMANSVIEGAIIGEDCVIGPFARLRPGSDLKAKVRIGNFVEIKESSIDEESKISHLSYVGDAVIGRQVNVGAGAITCNYDGVSKHQTIIEEGAFIGSNSQLVAPVKIGKGATIGAGSTITKDAPSNSLVLSRVEQKVVSNWVRTKRTKKLKYIE